MPISANGTPMLTSADAAALDASIQQTFDKGPAATTVYAQLSLGDGASITLDSPTSTFFVNANSSTATGGRLQCGHGDFPVVSPALTLAKNVAMAEMMSNLSGNINARNGVQSLFWSLLPVGTLPNWNWFLDPSGSAYGGASTTHLANSAAILPLTRVHDLTTATSVTVSFIVSSSRTVLPSRYPAVNVLRYDPFLNVTTSASGANFHAGWAFFPAPANITAYKNGGAPNTITVLLNFPTTIDVSKYLYFLALLDEDYASEVASDAPNEWLGAQVHVTTSDLHFQ